MVFAGGMLYLPERLRPLTFQPGVELISVSETWDVKAFEIGISTQVRRTETDQVARE